MVATALVSLLAPATLFPAVAESAHLTIAVRHVADVTQLLATLQDPNAAAQTRSGAAQELVRLAEKPESAYAVAEFLAAGPDRKEAQLLLLESIARAWDPPAKLYPPIKELAADRDAALAAAAASALSAYRSRQTAVDLVACLDPSRPPIARDAAHASLVKLTGREDLGPDPAAWNAWLIETAQLTPNEWDKLVAKAVWARAQKLDRQVETLADRLTEGYRRLYLALPQVPQEERVRLLVQMLRSDIPELQSLGFEMLNRELAAGNAVDAQITNEAVKMLGSREPATRARAAALVLQLAPQGAGGTIAAALLAETDPRVAAQLLAGVARWPDSRSRDRVLAWLESGIKPSPPSLDAVLALVNASLLTDPGDRERTLAAVRRLEAADLTPAACRLLVELGGQSDRDCVAGLLNGEASAVRSEAAIALAERPEFFDAILSRAKSDSSLFPAAVLAMIKSQPTVDGYLLLESLAAPTVEVKRLGLLKAAAALSASDLLKIAARPQVSDETRDAMLSRLIEYGAGLPRPGTHEDPIAINAGIVMLAQARLNLKRPDLALVALNSLPPEAAGIVPATRTRMLIVALLWTNRLDEAVLLEAPASDWLAGLRLSLAEPHARSILREIRARFGRILTEDQIKELNQLADRVAAESSQPQPTPETSPDD